MNAALQLIKSIFLSLIHEESTLSAECGPPSEVSPMLAHLSGLFLGNKGEAEIAQCDATASSSKKCHRKSSTNSDDQLKVDLEQLKALVSKSHPQFDGCEQCDSHEFLRAVLDILHKELSRGTVSQKEITMRPGEVESECAERWWRNHTRQGKSPVSVLFHGQQRTVVTCRRCKNKSVSFNPMGGLHIDLQTSCRIADDDVVGQKKQSRRNKQSLTVGDDEVSRLVNEAASGIEPIVVDGYSCDRCNANAKERTLSTAELRISTIRFPPILLIHFKRFTADHNKVQKQIQLPSTLHFQQFGTKIDYRLQTVISHLGNSLDSGHYLCLHAVEGEEQFVVCDDEDIYSSCELATECYVASYTTFNL